eukprot:1104334-Alexandrium_andersonii.AAC.1
MSASLVGSEMCIRDSLLTGDMWDLLLRDLPCWNGEDAGGAIRVAWQSRFARLLSAQTQHLLSWSVGI